MAGESIIDHKKWPYRGECKARLTLAAIQDEKMVDALASESRGRTEGHMIPDGRRLLTLRCICMPAEGLASFRLHHVDPIPIGGGRCCQELFTPLNIELTWRITWHFLKRLLQEGDGLLPPLGSVNL